MLLAVDIGNSSLSMGLFSGKSLLRKTKIASHPVRTEEGYTKEFASFLSAGLPAVQDKPLYGAILSSVVPEITDAVFRSLVNMTRTTPLILNSSSNIGISIDVLNPLEIGPDRLANAVAAQEIAGPYAIVVDFGTATTISVIKNSVFTGGSIMPGIELMCKSLHYGTSRLPLVSIPEVTGTGQKIHAIGKNTTMNIVSGIIYGTAGGVERLVSEIDEGQETYKVVITGGNSVLIREFLKRNHIFEPDLTLLGLRLIHERNSDA